LEVDMAVAGTHVPVLDMFRAVQTGVIDIAFVYAGFYTGEIPEAGIEIGLPYAWEDNEDAWDGLLNWGLWDIYEGVYAEHGFKWYAQPCNCYYHFGTTFVCDSPDTIAGKKIRATGPYATYVENLGGSAVVLPGAEMYMGLKLGTIDGVIYGKPGLEDWKLKEVLKSWVDVPNTGIAQVTWLINGDSWDALPEDIKETMDRDTPGIFSIAAQNYWVEAKYAGAAAARDYDFQNITWDAAGVAKGRAAGIATWDAEAAKSPTCAQLVEIYKKQARALGRM
jgi:TRAP-type C4-dicarboxylate transport system substrate-binding protein